MAELPFSLEDTTYPNVNALWGAVAAATLERLGVRTAVLSPGSRSAPLVVALAASSMDVVPVLDERSAGFFALGRAQESGQPVVLVCTSGSAGSHYLPAIIEAHESHVPLLVLTADRPPELRHCHSGQTIDQQKLYGGFVRFYAEAALPDADDVVLRSWRALLAQAHRRSLFPDTGPVHVNVPFRDPLAPVQVGGGVAIAGGLSARGFAGEIQAPEHWVAASGGEREKLSGRVLVVVGPDGYNEVPETGSPVLVEAAHAYRHRGDNAIAHYDLILRSDKLATALRPDKVVLVGPPPTSKVLRAWLGAIEAEVLAVSPFGESVDPLQVASSQVQTMPDVGVTDASYLATWRELDRYIETWVGEAFEDAPVFFEGKVPLVLKKSLPIGSMVCLASSMPIRDAEFFWPVNDKKFRPFANRGANGIDGTISTALGVAHGAESPVALVVGDLAFLHDVGALALRPRFRGSLTIFVINNSGGGIFENLPISGFEPPFEELFATPQEVGIADLCRAYGVEYRRPQTWEEVASIAGAVGQGQGIRVVELVTDRKRDTRMRREIFATIVKKLEDAVASGEIDLP